MGSHRTAAAISIAGLLPGLVKSLIDKGQVVTSNMQLQAVLSVALLAVCAYGGTTNRDGKAISLFNLVKFDNDICAGSTKNGTCYTKEECKDRGGKESKTCAEGFGVCCVIELKCGKSSSDNHTYLTELTPTASTGCTYTICPMASTICRIRYDFKEHTLANPGLATAEFTSAATPVGVVNSHTGYCLTDSFTIVNNGGSSSPVICGDQNKDQHMILDSDGSGCQSVVFAIGGGTTTRKWDIHVTQYTCEEAENGSMAGPKGCLQYFVHDTGLLRSFNFPAAATVTTSGTVLASYTHLANQDYKICIQKNPSKGRVCMMPIGTRRTTTEASTGNTGTFGVSAAAATNKKSMESSGVNTQCSEDYLAFATGAHFASSATIAAIVNSPAKTDIFKICGRAFNGTPTIIKAAAETACLAKEPFAVRVVFDDHEKTKAPGGTPAKETPVDEEWQGSVPGTIGFALVYNRVV